MSLDPNMLNSIIASELKLGRGQVSHTVALLDDGNTIPFMARYRKEMTGSLNEDQLRAIEARLAYLRKLEQRRETVLKSIDSQGKLTAELRSKIEMARVLQELEDLYLPFKPKRRTRATIARDLGLGPLAAMIVEQRIQKGSATDYAARFVGAGVSSAEEALAGARDIVAEIVAEDAKARAHCRRVMADLAVLRTGKRKSADDPKGKYQDYYEYAERLAAIPPHRVLAINRGERAKVLRVTLDLACSIPVAWLEARHAPNPACIFAAHLQQAILDGYQRLLRPALEREVRAARTASAEKHAIKVFGSNLRSLLLQPPVRDARVLAIDPGYRSGCKVAAVDETGKYMESCIIYPHPPQAHYKEAKRMLKGMVERLAIGVIAIGNGTASRATESLVAEMIAEGLEVSYIMVSEAGASIYSATKLAANELPGLDVSMRGAVSIARRLQDPLAELVKIAPRHIGVGLYQHDVDKTALGEALAAVVESAVNYVGVALDTASPSLLRHVSGLNARTAKAIVAHRDEHGAFESRRELLEVRGVGAKAFEQAAGFLRIAGGANPLDNTSIHPESYRVCFAVLAMMGVDATLGDLSSRVRKGWQRLQEQGNSIETLASELGTGVPTLRDMLADLHKPGRDPRDELPAPILREDILKMEDLAEGMVLAGTVRNVVDFGVFVDIGVKQNGLVHVSELADRFVRHPLDIVSVGDVVQVRVISLDPERGRIGLSIKAV